MNASCWMFHSWGKWLQYEEQGFKIMDSRYGPMSGGRVPYSEVHQMRRCTRCGKMQDEFLAIGKLKGSPLGDES